MKWFDFKSAWSYKSDWILVQKSLVKAFQKLFFLIQKNAILIIVFVLLEMSYFYFLFPAEELKKMGELNELFEAIGRSSFSLMQWAFLVFLVPFQLYNEHNIQSLSKPALRFKSFLARSIWPVIIDPIKSILYILLCVCGWGLLFVIIFVTAWFFKLAQNIVFQWIFGLSAFLVIVLPAVIKAVQFILIPMVIFFNKEYRERKKSSLALSVQVSQGLFLAVLAFGIAYISLNTLTQIGHSMLFEEAGGSMLSDTGFLFYGSNALISCLFSIFSSACIYYIYAGKDKNMV